MPNEDIRSQAIALYDRFTHDERRNPDCSGGAIDPPLDRRLFMGRMVALAGSVAAAEALIGAISASPAAAAIVPENDRRIRTSTGSLLGMSKFPRHSVYIAEPARGSRGRPTVLVIHENRGLNAHIRDVTRRLAVAGFYAVAPDFLSPSGGTPADEDAARGAIGKLDLATATGAAVEMLAELKARLDGGKVGAVGFCWGGGFVNRLAVAAGDKLDAGVVYYGPGPDPAEASRVQAPLMLHHAGLDARIAQTLWPWIAALRAAGKRVTYFNYEGVNHAFNNDTSAERYNQAAADLAWKRTLRFFRQHLA